MATIVLSAAGAAAGSAFGGTVLGLSGAVIGRAVGATLGRVIDQKLLGAGSEAVETGRVDRFRLTGAGEGAAIGQAWGAVRLGGQVIWASRFEEHVREAGGGKGGGPSVRQYTYSVSLAIALCEGEIARVGRIWADGAEIARRDLDLRVYTGSEDQMPDPLIAALEGEGQAPAYRGLAYVVIESLGLERFGNRVPQFSFEVIRHAQGGAEPALAAQIEGVALIPGSGEYALATTPVHYEEGPGAVVAANQGTPSGQSDFATALEILQGELPACRSTLLVVSWFGDDLRCGQCTLRPKVERRAPDGVAMPWEVGGLTREEAEVIATIDARPVYGGTPADLSVIEAIGALRAAGKSVVFYPFILMDQLADNGLPDPWSDAGDQPPFPWRGRITLSVAPGRAGSPDASAGADEEVAAFFGQAEVADFALEGTAVRYSGPEEWSFRRFILHNAWLCRAAGGVDAFCIGSEMRSLTRIRSGDGGFPAVAALCALAADVRAILGPDCKISYAADWSEYGSYVPPDGSGDLYFPLDALWGHPEIDFVGIDNYLPLSDWREGCAHADAAWETIYNLDYLKANILGGEYHDWYYANADDRAAQRRSAITDGAHGEPWVYRAKDIRSWWENRHQIRVDGVRGARPEYSAPIANWQYSGAVAEPYAGPAVEGYPRKATLRTTRGLWGRAVGPVLALSKGEEVHLRLRVFFGSSGRVRCSIVCGKNGFFEVSPEGIGRSWLPDGLTSEEVSAEMQGDGSMLITYSAYAPQDGNFSLQISPSGTEIGQSLHVLSVTLATSRGGSTAWEPGGKPIWFTEYGCPAVDKGTNQPNVFYDPKSSESASPHFSSGLRDDLIQAQYLRAMIGFWSDPDNNPVSDVYGGAMIDMGRAHVWTWDTRPYPYFPARTDLWSDGANYEYGHWINGRISAQALGAVVAEICARAGVHDVDVGGLYGLVRGYTVGETDTARAALQPLMLAHGFEAIEREGRLVFANRSARARATLDHAALAVAEDLPRGLERVRDPEAESAGRVRLVHIEEGGSYATRSAEALLPDEESRIVAASEVPLVMTGGEARATVARWLAEARVGRDRLRLALPPSQAGIGAGDVVRLPAEGDGEGGGGPEALYRIDRLVQGAVRMAEAVRIEGPPCGALFTTLGRSESNPALAPFLPILPVFAGFLDLPLLRGDEIAHAPHLAVAARPWPGDVAVYESETDSGFRLNRLVQAGAIVGLTETPLPAGAPGVWERGPALRVRLSAGGSLAGAAPEAVLGGANLAAIGGGAAACWEVFQFVEAELVAPETWELRLRLRGQAGTEADMPAAWPAGSLFVLLDGAVGQIVLPSAARGVLRHYRIGPAARAYDDDSYTARAEAFEGVGLRPYAPCHLRARRDGAGGLELSWIRRTRIDGDSWAGLDVPLGEAREHYMLRLRTGPDGPVRREVLLEAPRYAYGPALRAQDGLSGAPFIAEVAQISESYGLGPLARIMIDE